MTDPTYLARIRRIFRRYSPFLAVFGVLDPLCALSVGFGAMLHLLSLAGGICFVAFLPGLTDLVLSVCGRRAFQVVGFAAAMAIILHPGGLLMLIASSISGTCLAFILVPADDDNDRKRVRDAQSSKIKELVADVQRVWGPGAVPVGAAAFQGFADLV